MGTSQSKTPKINSSELDTSQVRTKYSIVDVWNLNDQQFNIIERFYNAYYENEPEGAAFPMEDWGRLVFMEGTLRGSDWHGELDLTDQKELLNFKNYVAG